MTQKMSKRIFTILFFVFLFCSLINQAKADTVYGTIPTGLMELKDYKYSVYLYVPPAYEPDKDYPLLIALAGEGESPEKNMEYWMSLGKKHNVIIVSPAAHWPEDLPYQMDRWLIQLKDEIAQRYRVSPTKTYLVGKNGGAHYASYLGVNYPDQFSAVAALGGSWVGKYEKLMHLRSRPEGQVPFLVMTQGDQVDFVKKTEAWAYEFEKKGYPIYLRRIGADEDVASDDFKKQILDWFEEKSEDWQSKVAKSKKTFRSKFDKAVKDFFTV
ncbi:MAG: hypothetical protein HYZ84_01050 [Candidatus Omnitrophica bacterium]|nr:hypothetical protein [Candidatus Omnitrophota bacterium]